ncbi:MAG: Hsp20/alpha crystallin family protein [Ferruginibacter sp.]
MSTKAVSKKDGLFPAVLNDFFRPWNSWFDKPETETWGNMLRMPAVNIMEYKDDFKITLAVPGIKKEILNIDMYGSMLTVSAGAKKEKETAAGKYTRKEYNYSSFSRSFTLPEGVVKEKITATFENGELTLTLPKMEAIKKSATRHISVE